MTSGAYGLTHRAVIECNRGGCWLACDVCGLLDQGDSSESMERMERTKAKHEAEHAKPDPSPSP